MSDDGEEERGKGSLGAGGRGGDRVRVIWAAAARVSGRKLCPGLELRGWAPVSPV